LLSFKVNTPREMVSCNNFIILCSSVKYNTAIG